MKIIELKTHNELPAGVEMVLYEPPYYESDPIHEVAAQFRRKYGNHPQTIYQLGKRLFVIMEKK